MYHVIIITIIIITTLTTTIIITTTMIIIIILQVSHYFFTSPYATKMEAMRTNPTPSPTQTANGVAILAS